MPTEIHDRNEVRRLIEQGIQVVDVLGDDEYEDAHLPGAIHLPLRKIETDATRLLDPSRPVLVYCFDSA
jgi:rhodanese-related sulfurtransferase